MQSLRSRLEGRVDSLTEELLGARERHRSAEQERDEANQRLTTLQEEMKLVLQHSDQEQADLKQRVADLQQELSNVRVSLLAANDDTSRPDLALVQRVHELEDQVEEQKAAALREKEQINSEHRIEVARMRGLLRRTQDDGAAASAKVTTLQAELQKQTEYFQEESAITAHQLEILRAENSKYKGESRALAAQLQRDQALHERTSSRLQRELEHSVTLATEAARCRIRELEAELEALKGVGDSRHPA